MTGPAERSDLYERMLMDARRQHTYGPVVTGTVVYRSDACCVHCGGERVTVWEDVVEKRREKFGAIHLMLTLVTCGLWLLPYLAVRHKVVTGSRAVTRCEECGR